MAGGFIETLGELRDHGMGLFAHCAAPNTGHGSRLDLGALIDRLGEDHVYINDNLLARSLVCRRCGHRGAQVTVIANTRPHPMRAV